MAISGNKGEWSELYAFLKLMHDKKLSFGNARLEEKQPNEFIKIYNKTSAYWK